MYFITEGHWAVAYNIFTRYSDIPLAEELQNETMNDIVQRGLKVAIDSTQPEYICDYYMLNKKRSQFTYLALSQVKTFALSYDYLFGKVFSNYPNLLAEMKAESFSRYKRIFSKKVNDHRRQEIERLNSLRSYNKIQIVEDKKIYLADLLKERATKIKGAAGKVDLMNKKEKLENLVGKSVELLQEVKEVQEMLEQSLDGLDDTMDKAEENFVSKLKKEKEKVRIKKRESRLI